MQTSLYDKNFLLELDKSKNKTVYARITALTFDESPIETIEGRISGGGAINIDGNSAVRRTCSLTMVAQDFNYNNYYWGLNTKFKLEVGVENNINSNYPNIIWFKQGIYYITSFNTSRTTNNFTIQISGKDKMCMLNGELGGSLEASIDFGTIEEQGDDGIWRIKKIPIPEIIRNAVHTYGGEPLHNIIINDLEEYGLELMEYRYDVPMYLYREVGSSVYTNAILETDNLKCYKQKLDSNGNLIDGAFENVPVKLKDLTDTHLDLLVDGGVGRTEPGRVKIDNSEWIVAKVEFGQTAGYRLTDLVYAGDLIGNAGEALTSILDKIKNMLGEFEYFYDVDGRFVFQKKRSFINTLYTPISTDENNNKVIKENLALSSAAAYTFSGGELITAFNNNPNLSAVRNDYSIWGERQSLSGATIPVHMRYAIDTKPTYYKAFDGNIYTTNANLLEELKQQMKEEIKSQFYNKIFAYSPMYAIPSELPAPQRLPDGSWSPGWWDIRDWYNYYIVLTEEVPSYTMKWYSRNDLSGCVPALSLPITYTRKMYESEHVWLLIRRPDGKYNPQHGSGNPEGTATKEYLYTSYYDENSEKGYVTEPVIDQETGKQVVKQFIPPYNGCTDTHTYINFIEEDVKKQGNTVYFYNPAFPTYDSYDELIEDKINQQLEEQKKILKFVDWREIIYQMAKDYYKHNTEESFAYTIIQNNPDYYHTGRTGYEQYYIDIQGFWRQLYNPEISDKVKEKTANKIMYERNIAIMELTDPFDVNYPLSIEYLRQEVLKWKAIYTDPEATDGQITEAYNKMNSSNAQLQERVQKYELEKNKLKTVITELGSIEEGTGLCAEEAGYYISDIDGERKYWNKYVYENPSLLNFWIDFLDTEGELNQFSVKVIGNRSKVINDKNVKAIYFRDTPEVIFVTQNEPIDYIGGYRYIQVNDVYYDSMFSISSQAKSAKNQLDELLYKHGYCIESATITAIPIYYLEPNCRVHLYDKDTSLDGDYIVSKITLPLTYNGTMTLTATKAMEAVY